MLRFTEDELASRAFLRIARILFEQWEEFDGADTRLFEWLIDDRLTHVGDSAKGKDYREHVVPRVVIRDICLNLFRAGQTPDEVAPVIRRLLKTAQISRSEAFHIDVVLNLKTSMPNGWDYRTGDVLERLKVGGVELVGADSCSSEGRLTCVEPRASDTPQANGRTVAGRRRTVAPGIQHRDLEPLRGLPLVSARGRGLQT